MSPTPPSNVHPYQVTVRRISLPGDLPADRCQLRLVVDVRYDQDGKVASKSLVLPGSDSDWDCQEGKKLRRDTPAGAEVDLDQVSAWDKTARFSASAVDSLRVTLFDTHGDGFWHKVDKGLELILEAAEEVYVGEVIGAGSLDSKIRILFRSDQPATVGTLSFTGKGKIPEGSTYTVEIELERQDG